MSTNLSIKKPRAFPLEAFQLTHQNMDDATLKFNVYQNAFSVRDSYHDLSLPLFIGLDHYSVWNTVFEKLLPLSYIAQTTVPLK